MFLSLPGVPSACPSPARHVFCISPAPCLPARPPARPPACSAPPPLPPGARPQVSAPQTRLRRLRGQQAHEEAALGQLQQQLLELREAEGQLRRRALASDAAAPQDGKVQGEQAARCRSPPYPPPTPCRRGSGHQLLAPSAHRHSPIFPPTPCRRGPGHQLHALRHACAAAQHGSQGQEPGAAGHAGRPLRGLHQGGPQGHPGGRDGGDQVGGRGEQGAEGGWGGRRRGQVLRQGRGGDPCTRAVRRAAGVGMQTCGANLWDPPPPRVAGVQAPESHGLRPAQASPGHVGSCPHPARAGGEAEEAAPAPGRRSRGAAARPQGPWWQAAQAPPARLAGALSPVTLVSGARVWGGGGGGDGLLGAERVLRGGSVGASTPARAPQAPPARLTPARPPCLRCSRRAAQAAQLLGHGRPAA